MLNDAHATITGYVCTVPKFRRLPSGVPSLTMRIAWTPRRLDRSTGEWVDGNTSYASVICWRRLAEHAFFCLHKGDPVNVVGRLSVRDYEVDGAQRTTVEIDASSVGHDLNRGVASFSRVRPSTGQTAADQEGAMAAMNGQAGQRSPEAASPAGGAAEEAPSPGEEGDDLPEVLAGDELAEDGLTEDELAEQDYESAAAPDQVPAPF